MVVGAEGCPHKDMGWGMVGWHKEHTAQGQALRVGGTERALAHSTGMGTAGAQPGREDTGRTAGMGGFILAPCGAGGAWCPQSSSTAPCQASCLTPPASGPPRPSLAHPSVPHGWHQCWSWPVTEGIEHTPPAPSEMPVETLQGFGEGQAVSTGAGRRLVGGEQGWVCRRPGRAELQRCGRYVCGRQPGWGRRRERKQQKQQLL